MLYLSSLILLLAGSLQLTRAVEVFLSPSVSFLQSDLSPEDASAALSRHVGLEAFELAAGTPEFISNEEVFVGQGQKNILILTVDEEDASAIIPHNLHHAFSVDIAEESSLSSVISTYLHRASHEFSAIYSSFDFSTEKDVSSLEAFFESTQEPLFAGINLPRLSEGLVDDSEKLDAFVNRMHDLLEKLAEDHHFNLAVLSHSSSSLFERASPQETQVPLPPPPHQPIGSISTCFTSLDSCNNGTSNCSGHGECVKASKAGRSCFVCTCGNTTIGAGSSVKTTYWAGESCERKDISGPFVLLSGTVIAIILLLAGSVSLLYSIGDQPLPSTLLATAVSAKKD